MATAEHPESDFPNIGKVASRELAAHGYDRLDQLPGVSERELLAIHGVGPKAIRILREALAEREISFAPDHGKS
jgi:hypothetical protein